MHLTIAPSVDRRTRAAAALAGLSVSEYVESVLANATSDLASAVMEVGR